MTTPNRVAKLSDAPTGRTKGDVVHSAAKAAAGAIPFAGSAISEIIDKTFMSPADARMTNWLKLVTATVNRLIDEVEGLTIENISDNAAFTTAVIATSRTAMITDREEKLSILQCVLHTIGSGYVLDEVLRNTFFMAIDRYTPEHVLLLKRCADNKALIDAYNCYQSSEFADTKKDDSGNEYAQVETIVPWILPETSADIAKEIFSDLHRDRFCRGSEGFACTFTPVHEIPIATVRGEEFLRFIFGSTDEF